MKKQLIFRLIAVVGLFTPVLVASEATQLPSLMSWGSSEREGKRASMEDATLHKVLKLGPLAPRAEFFAIFDGHGGSGASKMAARLICESFRMAFDHLSQQEKILWHLINRTFRSSFRAVDILLRNALPSEGTTALAAFVTDDVAYLSWVGDSRGLVIKPDGTIKLATFDHKPDSPKELLRYKGETPLYREHAVKASLGGQYRVFQKYGEELEVIDGDMVVASSPWRIGRLSVSRTLGDDKLKEEQPLITSSSDMMNCAIESGDIIILACDGIWDVMSNETVAKFVSELNALDLVTLQIRCPDRIDRSMESVVQDDGSDEKMLLIARALRDRAYRLLSTDNLSVMIVKI